MVARWRKLGAGHLQGAAAGRHGRPPTRAAPAGHRPGRARLQRGEPGAGLPAHREGRHREGRARRRRGASGRAAGPPQAPRPGQEGRRRQRRRRRPLPGPGAGGPAGAGGAVPGRAARAAAAGGRRPAPRAAGRLGVQRAPASQWRRSGSGGGSAGGASSAAWRAGRAGGRSGRRAAGGPLTVAQAVGVPRLLARLGAACYRKRAGRGAAAAAAALLRELRRVGPRCGPAARALRAGPRRLQRLCRGPPSAAPPPGGPRERAPGPSGRPRQREEVGGGGGRAEALRAELCGWVPLAPLHTEADRRRHRQVLALLVRARLLRPSDADAYVATHMDAARSALWYEFAIAVMRQCILDRAAAIKDFPQVVAGLNKASQRQPGVRKQVTKLLEDLRAAALLNKKEAAARARRRRRRRRWRRSGSGGGRRGGRRRAEARGGARPGDLPAGALARHGTAALATPGAHASTCRSSGTRRAGHRGAMDKVLPRGLRALRGGRAQVGPPAGGGGGGRRARGAGQAQLLGYRRHGSCSPISNHPSFDKGKRRCRTACAWLELARAQRLPASAAPGPGAERAGAWPTGCWRTCWASWAPHLRRSAARPAHGTPVPCGAARPAACCCDFPVPGRLPPELLRPGAPALRAARATW
ncbi:unnamed protein product [Heterosigma akashiwo]